MKGWKKVAAVTAGVLLGGTATAWAALVREGSPYPLSGQPLAIYAGDFNGDGRPDVVTMDGNSSTVSVFLRQTGGFALESGSPFAAGSAPSGIALADFNGDGRLDMAISDFSTAGATVLLGQAGGGFAAGPAPTGLSSALGIAAGDFGGDARPDVAITSGRSVSVYINNGAQGFSLQNSYATGGTPRAVAAGDFNGDGLLDLAVINQQDNTVTILLRAIGAGFAPEGTAIAVGATPQSVVAADFNGDGRADLAVTGTSNVTVLLRSAADNGFTQEGAAIGVSQSPVGSTTADFDRDGRPDLTIAANSGAVDVLRRNAGGGFTSDPATPLTGVVNGVAAADFDGDGRPDIAAVSYSPEQFTVFLNPAPAAPPAPTPTPTPTATPIPSPVAGKSVNVQPRSGTVKIKRPGSNSYVTLTAGAQIPVGSSIDTRRGRITITAAQGKGKTAAADFFDGLFKLTQTAGSKPLTTLTLTEALSCPRAKKASAAAKKPKSRKLWGDGSGSFRTLGRYSAATVRGTRWLVTDTCTSTTTKVTKGVVSVRDDVKHKTIIVRAGKHYTARAR